MRMQVSNTISMNLAADASKQKLLMTESSDIRKNA